jgi:transcriptional regulator with XRE-family HTH domain
MSSKTMQTAGELVRKARQEAGLTANELGLVIGTSGNSILRYERGVVAMSLDRLSQIAEALGCKLVVELRKGTP